MKKVSGVQKCARRVLWII